MINSIDLRRKQPNRARDHVTIGSTGPASDAHPRGAA
jgi:hypothetical protein